MDIFFYLKFWFSFKRKVLVTRRLESVYDYGKAGINSKNIKLLVFDVDDTLAEHKGSIPQKTLDFFHTFQNKGYKIAILTNCGKQRRAFLHTVFDHLGVYIEPTNLKPNPAGYVRVCKKLYIKPINTAMFGEKMGTDMYGAYLAGYRERVLVKPYTEIFGGKKSSWIEQLLRSVENFTF